MDAPDLTGGRSGRREENLQLGLFRRIHHSCSEVLRCLGAQKREEEGKAGPGIDSHFLAVGLPAANERTRKEER